MARRFISIASGLMLACAASGCSGPHRQTAGTDATARSAVADPANGARIFRQCAACHNQGDGAGDRDGPNLWRVIGRPVATSSARFAYTAALKRLGGVWTCGRLDRWLRDPATFVPGTTMLFPGLPDAADRADVIAYLAKSDGGPGCGAADRAR